MDLAASPVRPARLAPLDAVVDRRSDGTTYVRSPYALAPYAAKLTERLEHWAAHAPERTFLAQRNAAGAWERLTYGDALVRVRRIAQSLLDRGLTAERPIAILSGNGITHGLLALAAMYVGVPYAPIAPAYSLLAGEHHALRHVLEFLRPGLVFAAEGDVYADVFPLVRGAEIVVERAQPSGRHSERAQSSSRHSERAQRVEESRLRRTEGVERRSPLYRDDRDSSTPGLRPSARNDNTPGLRPSARNDNTAGLRPSARNDSVLFAELESRPATAAVDAAHAAVGPDTIAKILFTSGSTGLPKGVITTQRMLCSNQEMLRSVMRFLAEEPPVLCDWLPWNHVFGGSHNFGIVLYNGGTLYIDDGRPTPAGIDETVRNLREIASTAYFNVPRGYEMLVPHLRRDAALRERFFSRAEILFYAAAGLGQRFWDELQALAVETCGERIRMVTGLGATESAPFALCIASDGARAGMVGLPVPGVELKLVPSGATLEARLRGPSITPGFWRDDARTRAAFDEEGYYRLGDAVAWVDPDDVSKGLAFDGRLNEDFKLSSGTWVRVGPLRARLLAQLGGYATDVVLAAPDRESVTALIFPNVAACRTLCEDLPPDAGTRDVLDRLEVRGTIARLLGELATHATGSSTCVDRAILLTEPPSMDAAELTDKGSINQRAVLRHRATLVDALYAAAPSPSVIVVRRDAPAEHAPVGGERAHG